MFLWQALKPQAVLAAVAALSKTPRNGSETPAAREDHRATEAPALRFANPYDPNSLT